MSRDAPERNFPSQAEGPGQPPVRSPFPIRASRALRVVVGCLSFLIPVALFAGAVAFVILAAVPRPRDTTEPEVFAEDGAELDYCQLPVLDDSGRSADEINKAFTPGCGWQAWPMPVLADCTEPLAEGVVDMRGLWRGRQGDVDHVERIEQCGNRTVITSAGVIHDFVTDGTLRNGARDVMGGGRCWNVFAAVEWRDGVMAFRPFGVPRVIVSRRLVGERLVWVYPGVGEVGMERICRVPEGHRAWGGVE